MRRLAFLLGLSMLVWACTENTSTTTVAPATTPASSTTATTSSTTSSIAPEWPELLVTNDDGVFYINTIGEITQLVKGRVAYTVDDTRGGLLFQVERDRSMSWWGEPYTGQVKDTRVWWVPRGAAEAQALLVPTAGSNLDLSLVDAIEMGGRTVVMYVRHDSTMEPGVGPIGWVDALRTFDLDERQITEIVQVGAYEYGAEFSGGGGQILIFEADYFSSRCGLVGQPPPGMVLPKGFGEWASCERGDPCPIGCVLSSNGSILAVGMTSGGEETIRVLDTRSGGVIAELGVELWGRSFDLDGGFLLVEEDDEGCWQLVDLSDTSKLFRVPVAGLARFVTAPVDIAGPVIPPTPAAIQLRADGLGVVDFGDPMDKAMAALTRLLGASDSDQVFGPPWPEGTNCFQGTGWGCDDYLRFVGWSPFSVGVVFSDRPHGVPAFVSWSHRQGDLRLETPESVGVGSAVADLRQAYGEALRFYQGLCNGGGDWYFWVGETGLWGSLSGAPDDPGTVVSSLMAGARSSC